MRRRQFILASLLAAGTPMAATANAAAPAAPDTAAAQAACAAWLKMLDAADTAGTWEAAASTFKAAVSAPAWQQAWQAVRQPLGAVRRRSQRSAAYTRSLPGAPDGDYVIVQLDTVFENKAQAIETVTMAVDRDGAWRVAGYFVR